MSNAEPNPDASPKDAAQSTVKGSARERIARATDAGSFWETDAQRLFAGAVCGAAASGGRPVCCFAQESAAVNGVSASAQAAKLEKVLDLALRTGAPIFLLLDGSGLSNAEEAFAGVYYKAARLSGVCPILCCVLGAVDSAMEPLIALSDYVVAVSGVLRENAASAEAGSEEKALALLSTLFSLLPSSCAEDAPLLESDRLDRDFLKTGNDPLSLVISLADDCQRIGWHDRPGGAILLTLSRIGGRSVGIAVFSGPADECEYKSTARFIRFCDCYSLPVITLIGSEPPGIHPALLYAYAEATVPKVTLFTTTAASCSGFGGRSGFDALFVWALPTPAPDPDSEASDPADGVIDPADTRRAVIGALETYASKRDFHPPKKHGNIPL